LSTIVALNEPLHLAHLCYRTRHFSDSKRCFDTLWTHNRRSTFAIERLLFGRLRAIADCGNSPPDIMF